MQIRVIPQNIQQKYIDLKLQILYRNSYINDLFQFPCKVLDYRQINTNYMYDFEISYESQMF